MELKDTIELMQSKDYKERFKAEYWQLKCRIEKLHGMLVKYDAGTLGFTPDCSIALLKDLIISPLGTHQSAARNALPDEVISE